VRPSPNSGTLGGLSAYTADVVNLFEVRPAHYCKQIFHEVVLFWKKVRIGCSPYCLGSLLSSNCFCSLLFHRQGGMI
jgi:hypothetical protein